MIVLAAAHAQTEAIEEAGTKPLTDLLKQLGGWPVLEGDAWDPKKFDLSYQMALLRNLNNGVLLAEFTAGDVTNSSRRIVQVFLNLKINEFILKQIFERSSC